MKIKESYTFDELCRGLTMPMSKFCQLAGITEPTLIRLRNGYSGRQSTINLILEAFSKVYGIEFDLSNVSGLTLQDKPNQKVKKPPVSTPTIDDKVEPLPVQKSIVEPKRGYSPRKTNLPDGAMLASKFAEAHNVKRPTFIDHMNYGLGPGMFWKEGVEPDDVAAMKERVIYSSAQHPTRPKETVRFLTTDQQAAAIQFWKRHNVSFTECDQTGCPCHQKGE